VHELIKATARQVVAHLNSGEVSHAEVLDLIETRVSAVDGAVNALPTLCFDRARAQAARIAALPVAQRGVLGGLPVPIKDLERVAGVRSTDGSRIYADRVPEASDHIVERIEAQGGVVYAKSNTPEFGAGGSTFNEVFGRTRNPWDLSRSAAGSSGGVAAALASGTAWVAQGSDMGGSLRNPASFCGVVGLRPSPGRVPKGPGADAFGVLSVNGPMARNVADTGLLLDAMAGPHPHDPRADLRPCRQEHDGALRDREAGHGEAACQVEPEREEKPAGEPEAEHAQQKAEGAEQVDPGVGRWLEAYSGGT